MKKLLSALLFSLMLVSILATSFSAVSGENGNTGFEKKPADASEGWTRYQLEEQDVYLKGVLAGTDDNSRKHSQTHYSNGLAVNFGNDASNIPTYTDFSEMTLDNNSSRIEVKINSQYAGASKITLYTRHTNKATDEVPLCVGIKVNDGAVQKVVLTKSPQEMNADYGKRITYTTVDITLKAGENVIRISPPYQTSSTKGYWCTFDCMDVMTVAASSEAPELTPVNVTWNYGYVKNDGTIQNEGNNGWGYSHTDVITVPEAGTTITFTDDDGQFASGSVYVVSSWKQEGGAWVFDAEGGKLVGNNQSNSPYLNSDGDSVYSYTTTKANETIRLCYRSEHTPSAAPTSHPTVYSDKPITVGGNNNQGGGDNSQGGGTGNINGNTGSDLLGVALMSTAVLACTVVLAKKSKKR